MNKMLEEVVFIEFNRQIGIDTCLMGFRSTSLASLAKPGQFLMIHLGRETKDPLLRRPFSIHGIKDKNKLMILYRIIGKGTSLLSTFKEGDPISVIGPLGNGFNLPRPNERTLFVAGGMGIAPLFFLTQVLNEVQKHKIKMFLGFPTSQEVVLLDQLKDLNVDLSLTTEDLRSISNVMSPWKAPWPVVWGYARAVLLRQPTVKTNHIIMCVRTDLCFRPR
jgi:dihydroorotate dehydrogenase electron transfer subunit